MKATQRQSGFTYLGLLLAIALLGIGLTAASEVWVTSAHLERMIELEWVGAQYVQAIGSYYEASPGSVKTYPNSLAVLLEDRRYLTTRRHLRSLYANPFTRQVDWELVRGPDGSVRGIRLELPTEFGGGGKSFAYAPETVGRK